MVCSMNIIVKGFFLMIMMIMGIMGKLTFKVDQKFAVKFMG